MSTTKTIKTVTMDIPEMDTKISDVSIDCRVLHILNVNSVYKLYKMCFYYHFH